eukprot:scaffold102406_cov19-Tisochrysis_lutea.AAC.1
MQELETKTKLDSFGPSLLDGFWASYAHEFMPDLKDLTSTLTMNLSELRLLERPGKTEAGWAECLVSCVRLIGWGPVRLRGLRLCVVLCAAVSCVQLHGVSFVLCAAAWVAAVWGPKSASMLLLCRHANVIPCCYADVFLAEARAASMPSSAASTLHSMAMPVNHGTRVVMVLLHNLFLNVQDPEDRLVFASGPAIESYFLLLAPSAYMWLQQSPASTTLLMMSQLHALNAFSTVGASAHYLF